MVDETASAETKPAKCKKDARLSKDGNWRLFPSDNHLLQYVSTGMYFGRVKIAGKTIRGKLDTNVYSTAKLRLLDFLKEQRSTLKEVTVEVTAPTFAEAQAL